MINSAHSKRTQTDPTEPSATVLAVLIVARAVLPVIATAAFAIALAMSAGL